VGARKSHGDLPPKRERDERGRGDKGEKERPPVRMRFWLRDATARIHPENGTFSWRFVARERLSAIQRPSPSIQMRMYTLLFGEIGIP